MNNLKKQIVVFEILSIILLICFTVSESKAPNIALFKKTYPLNYPNLPKDFLTDGIKDYMTLSIKSGNIWLKLELVGFYHIQYLEVWMKQKKKDQWVEIFLRRGKHPFEKCYHSTIVEPYNHNNISCDIKSHHSYNQLRINTDHNEMCIAEIRVYGNKDHVCSPNPCKNYGRCQSHGESYTCKCRRNYSGPKCELKINACWGHGCKNDAKCVETGINKFKCVCKEGYEGPRCKKTSIYTIDNCTDVKEETKCKIKDWCVILDPCANSVRCVNVNGTQRYVCVCLPFYTGEHCEELSACKSSPCDNGAACDKDGDSYKCYCVAGYKGRNCEQLDSCFLDPCKNEGICEDKEDSFKCKCEEGFKGIDCGTIEPCWQNHCGIGGKCVENGDSYNCTCKEDYRGEFCDERNPCLDEPCNNGTCEWEAIGYQCACHKGYGGTSCDEKSSPIGASPPGFIMKYYLVIALLLLIIIAVLVVCCCLSKCKKSKK